jgi:F420-non-reducing hydrogenase small subunit
MLSAISSVIDSTDPDEIEEIISTIADPVGTFYRFSLAASMLGRKGK